MDISNTEALEFLNSHRGRYILAQALTLGIEKLSEVDERRREVSNIADMEYILESLFKDYADVFNFK
jgi:hypothetical protein